MHQHTQYTLGPMQTVWDKQLLEYYRHLYIYISWEMFFMIINWNANVTTFGNMLGTAEAITLSYKYHDLVIKIVICAFYLTICN